MAGITQVHWRKRLSQLRDTESYVSVASGISLAEYDTIDESEARCELIEGELFVAPAPYWGHQNAQAELFLALGSYVKKHDLGQVLCAPSGVRLGHGSEVQPDILYIPKTHHAYRKNVAYATEPPVLVIEILSPGSVKHDRERKAAHYAKYGVPNYWIADSRAATLEAYILKQGMYELATQAARPALFSAPPFPDLQISLAEVFTDERK